MSSWLDRLHDARETPHVAAYKEVRAASQSWFKKIMQQPAWEAANLHRAAKKLGLPVHDRTIVFDDENDTALLMDYFLLEYRQGGKSIAESCVFAPGELTAAEAEYHQAVLASRTSLFAVTGTHDHEPMLRLRDLLEPEAAEIWLTDLGFAASIRRLSKHPLLFTRVVPVRSLHITGGFSFLFDPGQEPALVDGYRRAMWPVPVPHRSHRRTSFFLDRSRRLGQPLALADVVATKKPGV
ncbi:MAG: hypothetical protein ACREIA_03880 [Opitutaceae bacterium]